MASHQRFISERELRPQLPPIPACLPGRRGFALVREGAAHGVNVAVAEHPFRDATKRGSFIPALTPAPARDTLPGPPTPHALGAQETELLPADLRPPTSDFWLTRDP